MTPIIIISVVYALIRAKHDSYVNNGPWKLWAFIEGVWVAWSVSSMYAFYTKEYISLIFLPLIFAFSFWIVFDLACGWFRARNPFHFGSGKFDQIARKVTRHGALYLLFKAVWLTIIIGTYKEIIQ